MWTGLEPRRSDPDPASQTGVLSQPTFPPRPCRTLSPADVPGWAGGGRRTEPRLRAHPCLSGTQAAWLMGRSTLKAVAGSLPTAPAPPACVTRALSPVPESSVSAPVPSPTRGPVTAALDALVLGVWGGAGTARTQSPVAIFLPLPWAGGQGSPVPGWSPFLHTLILSARGSVSPAPGTAASLKAPWSCFALTPSPKTVSTRAESMSPGRASSLGQTPAKCASVRWVRAALRGGDWGGTAG